MRIFILNALAFLLIFAACKMANAKSYELPSIQVVPIEDNVNDRNYELFIKLPESYQADSERHYPVIYYTDAVWHLEAISSATAYIFEDVISVGISWQKDNNPDLVKEVGEHVSRFRDYSIWESSSPERQAKYQFGQADKHFAFIRDEVIKYAESNYRIDPANRTYFGYSLSGLFGVYALLTQSNIFKNYIVGSPSVQQLEKLKKLTDKTSKQTSANVFISHGSLEVDRSTHIDAFIQYLKNNYKNLSVTKVMPEGTHGSAFPETAVRSMFWLANLNKQEEK